MKEVVDLVVHHGIIYTIDAQFSTAEAMAVDNGRILAIGTNQQILSDYKGRKSLDLQAKCVLPGLIDSHCHLIPYGKSLFEIDLRNCASWDEVVEKVKNYAAQHPEGWIIGRAWDHTRWPGQQIPENSQLNQLFPDRPVFLQRVDIHAAVVNDFVLQQAGLDIHSQIPGGSLGIRHDRLSGLLIDAAQELVMQMIPKPSEEELEQYILAAQDQLLAKGISSIGDALLDPDHVAVLARLQNEGKLFLRVYGMIPATEENVEKFSSQGIIQNESLHIRAFKLFADGTLGSRSAWLLEPYADAPEETGLALLEREWMLELGKKIYAKGFQLNTHAIGDAANRFVLDVYEEILGEDKQHRWRIEHAQLVSQHDLSRFGHNSIIPCIQPSFATTDAPWLEVRLGTERVKNACMLASFHEDGNSIALGTDFPVENINPFEQMYAAVCRLDVNGNLDTAFQVSEALNLETVLRAYTYGNAYAQFEEELKGSLEKGKLADFVVIEKDLLTIPEDQIYLTEVAHTYIEGACVYSKIM